MKSRFSTIVTPLLILSFFLLGITPAFSSTPLVYNSAELTNRLKTGAYLQKTDNLMIIVDGQGETFFGVGEPQSQKIARHLIANIGKTIPNIPHRRLLRIHGPKADRFEKDFSTIFGLYHLDAKGFTPIIATKTLAISDFDPLGMTFISAAKDLRKISGSHAVILISDGINIPKSAIYESAYMKKKYGGSVCYYPILIGNDPQGAKNMSTIAKVGGCGFLAQYEAVDSPAELTDFVEKIFFAKRRVPVKPVQVVEPEPEETPETTVTEEPVEPVMTDTEEVTEIVEEPVIPDVIEDQYIEDIPAVDADIIILERQLPHDKVVTIELHVEFDLNKATLRAGYEEEINKVADFMLLYPETEALLEGHTCDLGSDAYNQSLSSRRANTVKKYLVKKFGIDADRLKTRGAGESEPIADNTSEEGRMKNRRVMAVISTIVTDYIIVEQEILKSDFLSDDFVLPPVDQIVDEMMQQEVVEEPQEEEIPVGGEDVSVAPEADAMATEATPEVTSVTEPAETPMEEAAQISDDASVEMTEEIQKESADETPTPAESEEVAVDAAFEVQKEESAQEAEMIIKAPKAESSAAPAEMQTTEPEVREESIPVEKEEAATGAGEEMAQQEQQSTREATPQAGATDEVVVVAPGESAFDDEQSSLEASDELISEEPILTPEEQAVADSVSNKEKEKASKPAPEKVTTEQDSYL